MRGLICLTLGSLLALLRTALADTPAWCYSDQVLGTWRLTLSSVDVQAADGSDRVSCPLNITPSRDFDGPVGRTTAGHTAAKPGEKNITLYAPNIAVDEDTGAAGSWTMQYTQAVQISLSGWTYTFFVAYERFQDEGVPYVRTDCGHSQPGAGWAYQDGAGRRYRACLSAELVKPEASNLINVHREGEPGPVNPDTGHSLHPTVP